MEKQVSAVSILHCTRPVHSTQQNSGKLQQFKAAPVLVQQKKETDYTSADTATKQNRKLQQCKAALVIVQQNGRRKEKEKKTTPTQTPLQNRAENYSSLRQPLLSSNRKKDYTSEDSTTKQSRKLQQCKAAPVTVQQKKKNRPHLCRHHYKTEQKTTTLQGSPQQKKS